MIGIAVILGIASITLCNANVNVENELMEIRTILIHQKREIKALRNETAFYVLTSGKWQWKYIILKT